MKILGKYVIYSLIMVFLIVGSLLLIKKHPEVQFAFLLPGVFIVVFCVMRDDLFSRQTTVRSFRGR